MLKRIVFTVALALAISQAIALADNYATPRKKLIELGWDIPTTRYLKERWREMEENAPFDGVVYDLVATNVNGDVDSSQTLFTPNRWNRDDFQTCVDDLKACDFQRYKHNFIRINFHPANFDWQDDDAWNAVSEKGAVCAWVAKETNGNLCLDFESYGAQLFRYDAEKNLSFDEAKALARRRGAQFGDAVVAEKPDVVFLCLWMNSINYHAGRSERPDSILRGGHYGLLPSFIDGLLDAAAPETRFVEGCENGYYMNGREEYQRASLNALLTTGPGVALVSPENRAKYRAQVSSGFGFYLDMYSNPEGSSYYRGPEPGETRFDRLCANLTAAWDAADEYVWVYGEQKRWWAPENNAEWKSWEEALPGITDFIDELSNPDGFLVKLKDSIFNSSVAKNLIVNGDFADRSTQPDGTPSFANWGTWRYEESYGKFIDAQGKPGIRGDISACYIQSVPAEPGKFYFVYGKIGMDESVDANLTARWQDADGRWVSEWQDVRIVPKLDSKPDANGRREAYARVKVPTDAHKLVVLLSASATTTEGTATFDDVRVYPVQ